jgi:plastocyanin
VGDTVEWQGMSIGFHTIDLPGRTGGDIPLITPQGPISGINDAAGNPFWFNGLPNLGFTPSLFAPIGGNTYDGTERVASGLPLGPPSSFKVTFTKPGVYEYFCDVHYDMHGFIVVKPQGAHIPSQARVAQKVARAEARDLRIAAALDTTQITGNHVSVGVAGRHNVEILAMFPSSLSVSRGTTVSFEMPLLTGETHTVTFGPDDYRNALSNSFTTATFDPRAIYPSSPTMPIVLTPTSHGNGFANTGALDRDPDTPLPPSGTITFDAPGVYHYECLIHPFMRGTITVS